ncbi:hypothetical protein HUK65_02625 [Rhodobacteraceae bacterium 2376]|uniref:Uncharacterized protein n=1 Tax=Rhabdonatronobacter sediminivivens TaxID=2743469 RepID=A0A7Z0KXR2_9RHOB|nr:hypothetical protein [Rhabdonatronobacter sediminivivens]NYS23871.1 hypothetical protein [Rhabdonatronobacter sediminivivens]
MAWKILRSVAHAPVQARIWGSPLRITTADRANAVFGAGEQALLAASATTP